MRLHSIQFALRLWLHLASALKYMRRFLTISCTSLALIISVASAHAFFVPQMAHAQAVPTSPPSTPAPTPTVVDSISDAQRNQGTDTSGSGRPTSFSVDEGGIFSKVMIIIMSIFAWLLGIAMVTLDYSVFFTVVTMGEYVKELQAVGVTWRILRDIGNILLIFGFLAVGITTILNVDWYGDRKKMIPMLIIAAVFMNFSLFATSAIIDMGNLFATQFYKQINGGEMPGTKLSVPANGSLLTQAGSVRSSISNEVISQKIMANLGLTTLYGAARNNTLPVFEGNNMLFIGVLGILLFIVAAFVMFSLALILIVRFIVLIFLLLLSPIGFAGWAVPQLASTSHMWWDTLIKQTITAPILLLLLYIALAVITDPNFLRFGANPDYMGFIQKSSGDFNVPGLASMLLSFSVAMGLLLAVTYFSKKLGAIGGDWAMKTAGKLTFGLTAAGMRSTAGFGFNAASRRFSSSKLARVPVIGRAVGGALNYGAKSNFDVRSTGVIQKLSDGKINPGEAQKGGYREREEKSVKAHQAYIKSVGEDIETRKAGEVAKVMKVRSEAEKVVSDEKAKFKSSGGEDLEKKKEEQAKTVKDLEEEVKKNAKSDIVGPAREQRDRETEQKLTAARQEFKTIEDTIATLSKPLEEAEKDLEEKKKDEKTVTGNISKEKKEFQVAYAEGMKGESIKGSLLKSLVYGSSGSIAANKIIKEAFKNEDNWKKVKDLVKKSEESEEGEGKKGKGEGKEEKPKEKDKPEEKPH